MKKIQVMMADDHMMVREGVKALLELDGDIKVIAQANDGIECLDVLKKVNPDVLLLDINMPKLDGLTVLETIVLFASEILAECINLNIRYNSLK